MRPLLPPLSGPIPVLPTMFADASVDRDRQAALTRRLVHAGLSTIVTGGLEGEGPTLELAEHTDAVAAALEAGAVVGASICTPGTDQACEEARRLAAARVSFLVVSPPPYNRPTGEGIFAHVARIANAARMPVILRDDPARTRALLTGDLLARLCHDGIVSALVLPPGDVRATRRVDALSRSAIPCIAGSDFDAILQQWDDRAAWLSSTAVVDPDRCSALHHARLKGDWRTAALLSRELCRLMRALETDEPAVTTKAALESLGFATGGPRLPLVPASDEARQTIASAVRDLDLASVFDRRVTC